MKKLIFALLIASPLMAQERVSLTVDGDTGALCYQLIGQVSISGSDPKMLESAQKLAAAKTDLEKAFQATKEEKEKANKVLQNVLKK